MNKKQILLNLMLLPVAAMAQHSPVGIVSVQDSTKSVQLGIVSNIATDGGKGLQLSGFSNMSARAFRGVQLSGVSNISRGLPKGMQISGLLNVSSAYMRGLQLAAVNYADSLNGAQFGLVNVARAHPRGWQVGLVNITHDTIVAAGAAHLPQCNPAWWHEERLLQRHRARLQHGQRLQHQVENPYGTGAFRTAHHARQVFPAVHMERVRG